MPYEGDGSFTRELVKQHFKGEHSEDRDSSECPLCYPEEYKDYGMAMEFALELQGHIDAHGEGNHSVKRESLCIECVENDQH